MHWRVGGWCCGAPVPEQPRRVEAGPENRFGYGSGSGKRGTVGWQLSVRYLPEEREVKKKNGRWGWGGGNMPEVKKRRGKEK